MLLSNQSVVITSHFTIIKDVSCPIKDYQISASKNELTNLFPSAEPPAFTNKEFTSMNSEFTSPEYFQDNN